MSTSNCCFLTSIQVFQEGGQVVWDSHLFFRIFHSLLWSTESKALAQSIKQINVFLELSCFIDDPADAGNLTSGSSAFSKTSLNIWKFTVHVLLKPGLENWNECNCAVIWTFFGIAFLWKWNENWPFPVLWPLLSFPYLLAYEHSSQRHLSGFEIDPLEFHHLH